MSVATAAEAGHPSPPRETYGYIPALDGFRALAITVVLAAHFTHSPFVPGGFGVTLFFFISGLLITRLLISEHEATGKVSLPRFYARRFLRLAPALLLMIAVVTGVTFAVGQKTPIADVLAAVFYVANYYWIFVGFTLTFGVLWSLAVEEHYYLLYPALLGPLIRTSRPLLILALLCALALVWRTILMVFIHPPADYTYMATDARFDSILYGALLGVWLHKRPDAAERPLLASLPSVGLALVVLVLTFAMKGALIRETIRYSLQGLALLPIVAAITFSKRNVLFGWARAVLSTKPLTFYGKLSYSIYLWHFPCIFAVTRSLPNLSLSITMPLALLVTFAAALFSYLAVERTFLRLRRRFGSHAA